MVAERLIPNQDIPPPPAEYAGNGRPTRTG